MQFRALRRTFGVKLRAVFQCFQTLVDHLTNPYQAPSTDTATESPRSGAPRWFGTAMAASAIVGAIWTLPLVWYSGSEEPFVGDFDLVDWFVCFVGGGLGVLFWITWSGAIICAVVRRWWPLSMLLLLVIAILIGYLQNYCFTGYLGDRATAIKMRASHQ